METTVCSCTSCDSVIGEFINLWIQIGKTYFSPVVNSKQTPTVLPKGAVRNGSKGTLIEGCELQDQACSVCGVLVGIRFLSVPVNHALAENQLLLNLDSAVSAVGSDRKAVEITITRRLKLQNPSAAPKDGDSTPDADGLGRILVQLDTHGQAIDLIHQAGSNSISKLDEKLAGISRDLTNIRRDFSRSQEDLNSLKSQVQRVSHATRDKSAFDQLEEQIAGLKQVAEDQTALDLLQKDVSVLKLAQNHLGSQSRGVSSRVEGVERKMLSAVSEFRDEITRSIQKEFSTIRAEVAQHKADATRAQDEELAVLRNELPRHRKHVEQMQSKELSKLRAELTEQQKAADRTREEQVVTLREEIALQRERISQKCEEELSTIHKENTKLQQRRDRDHEKTIESLYVELSRCKEHLEAVEERFLPQVDVGQLKEQLDKARAEATSFPRQLEILKSRITDISNRTSQIDNLRVDVEFLQLKLAEASRQGSEERQGYASHADLPKYHQLESNATGTLPTQIKRVAEGANARRRSAPAGRAMFDQDELADEEVAPAPRRKRKSRDDSSHVSAAKVSHTKRQLVDIEGDVFLPARKKLSSTGGFELAGRISSRKRTPPSSGLGKLVPPLTNSSPLGEPSGLMAMMPSVDSPTSSRNSHKARRKETKKAPRRPGRPQSSSHEPITPVTTRHLRSRKT